MNQKEINDIEWRDPGNWFFTFYASRRDSRFIVPMPPWLPWWLYGGLTLNLGRPGVVIALLAILIGGPLLVALILLLVNLL